MREFLVFGHRGVSGHYPENTRISIEAAIHMQLQWIEVDIRHVAGRLIVFHDRRLERLCAQPGRISDLTQSQLDQLSISQQPLLMLSELLELLPPTMHVNLEIKGPDTAEMLCDFLHHAIVQQKITAAQILLSSFDHEQLFICKQRLPKIKRGMLIYGVRLSLDEHIQTLDAYSVHQSIDFIDRNLVKQCQLLDKKLFVYTVNELDDIKDMIALGVDGVFSNYPERVLEHLADQI